MRTNRSKTRMRRSHHALKEPALSTCQNCGEQHRPHHMCLSCGFYNGRQVVDLAAERKKREERMQAKKEFISADSGAVREPQPEGPQAEADESAPAQAKARAAKGKAAARKREESAPHTTLDEV